MENSEILNMDYTVRDYEAPMKLGELTVEKRNKLIDLVLKHVRHGGNSREAILALLYDVSPADAINFDTLRYSIVGSRIYMHRTMSVAAIADKVYQGLEELEAEFRGKKENPDG